MQSIITEVTNIDKSIELMQSIAIVDTEQEVRELAERCDEPIRRKLFEYLMLREQLIRLTGVEDPSETTLVDILPIQDLKERRLAAQTAKRMRRLVRETFSKLKE
jgi:hypothetical protein